MIPNDQELIKNLSTNTLLAEQNNNRRVIALDTKKNSKQVIIETGESQEDNSPSPYVKGIAQDTVATPPYDQLMGTPGGTDDQPLGSKNLSHRSNEAKDLLNLEEVYPKKRESISAWVQQQKKADNKDDK